MTESPRVFEQGTVTVVIGQTDDDVSVYVGTHKIGSMHSLGIQISPDSSSKIEITFASRTGNQDLDLRVEEDLRLASFLPQVVARRR